MEETRIEQELVRLRDRLYRFAHSMLGNALEAEDATHDALERLWRRRAELMLIRNVEAFAMSTLRNGCIDRLRRRRESDFEPHEGMLGVADGAAHDADREWVRMAMQRLPLKQREVLHLKEIEGYTSHEIAALFAIEENQVRVLLSRGRKALRAALEKLS